MANENFIIYRSSAGSGKTYTLTREYLKLALKRKGYYKHILAVTFTNKAMQEMKNRIIQKLDEFSRGRLDGMAEELMAYTHQDVEQFQRSCERVLTEILHGYSHFSVNTIDTFFQKVIRSFAKELGLAGSYRLELNHDLILVQIVDDLLLEATENKQIRDWLIRFAREELQEGNNWDIRKDIKRLANEIFSENFKSIEEEIGKQDKDLTRKLKRTIDEALSVFENQMDKWGSDGLAWLEKYDLKLEDFSGGKSRSVLNQLTKIRKNQKNYVFTPTFLKTVKGEGTWYTKTSKKKDVIDAALAGGLEDLLKQLVDFHEDRYPMYVTAKQVKKFIYGYGLLADLNRKLREYKKDNDVMLISDATRFLKELVRDSDTPFVYEKVGSFYNHYLIDEFQDTSGFQWDSFRPLVEDSLAQGNGNLVVGDIKQSIYRWRGGDWELLLNKIQDDVGAANTRNEVLDTNYRSEAAVIEFNNHIFQKLPQELMKAGAGSVTSEAWEVLRKVYEDTYQQVPEQKLASRAGYVNITFLQDEDDWKWKDQVKEKLPKVIEELQDKGVSLRETAVLVRNNREGKLVADLLAEYVRSGNAPEGYRYDVVSNESLFIAASPAVRVVIAALRYLHDNKDQVVKAELVFEYQKSVKGNETPLGNLFQSVPTSKFYEWLPEAFRERQKELLYLPFYEMVEQIINIFEANTLTGQFPYLQTFQDLVLKFSQNEKGDISSFLEWWDEKASRESIKVADDLDAIRILTIHKSKGLEFPAVIVPYCGWEIDHKPLLKPILWTSTNEEPFDVGHLPLIYGKDLANTFFQEGYENEKIKAHLDNLNLLYVAFTRAAHNLWVFAPCINNAISTVLRSVLEDSDFELREYWDAQKNVFEYGNRDFLFEKKGQANMSGLTLQQYRHFNWRKRITVRQRGKGFATSDETRTKINYGIMIHKLLSRIRTIEDKPKAIQSLYFEEGLNEGQRQEIIALIDKLLDNQKAKNWFSGGQIFTEVPILTPTDEYRPDRVVVKDGHAIIVDYKTGLMKPDDLEQMERYKRLLQEMGYPSVDVYLWYLSEDNVVQV